MKNVSKPCPHGTRPQGHGLYALFSHSNGEYGRCKKVLSSLREDRKTRVKISRWLLGIMSFSGEKNLQKRGFEGNPNLAKMGEAGIRV